MLIYIIAVLLASCAYTYLYIYFSNLEARKKENVENSNENTFVYTGKTETIDYNGISIFTGKEAKAC